MSVSRPHEPLSPVKQALLALEQMTAKVAALEQAQHAPIAVVGLACRFPGAPDLESYWRLLREGRDAVGEVPASRWDGEALYDANPDAAGRLSTKWGGFLDDVDRFDAEFFGIAPREAASMDPQQRLLLEVAWEALEDAAQGPERLAGGRTGVFVGITGDEYAQLFQKAGDASKFDMYFASGVARSVAGGRISYVLGAQGPNMSIDTACSSSLVAVHTACLHLRAGECRMALAGGANVILSPEITMAFSRAHMMAADGRCKAFDEKADGFVRAEGCGIVVLKRLADAIADGDRVLAVIRGSAINQDGRSSGLTAPSGPAQEAVIRDALTRGGLSADQVDYIEAHGTGTSLGDPIEAHAIREVFGRNRDARMPLVVGSVKANIGHLEAAAGIAGLIKVVLSLQREWIPAQLHFHALNPHIDWSGAPVEIPVGGREWSRGARPRLAGVSAFGFSGTNAHVIVEEAPASVATDSPAARTGVLTLSARTQTALVALASRYSALLHEHPELTLADVCFTSNIGRTPLAERAAVVAGSTAELRQKLVAFADDLPSPGVVRARVSDRGRTKIAFLFSGQGAQYAQMGRELYDAEPVFRSAIDECARILSTDLDCPLTALLWGAATDRLNETQYTQPALFAIEWALAQLWRSWGVEPAVVLGHSVGEYVAACVAGVYSLADGLHLVAARGRLMGALPREAGAMAAILAPADDVRTAVARHGGAIDVAAVNGATNVVVAGARADVEAVASQFERAGCRVERLRVSHAFHSPLMAPIEEAFEAEAGRVSMTGPQCTLVSSVTGAVAHAGELVKPAYWRRQVRAAVQFHDALKTTAAQGCTLWIEIGPGSALLGMTREVVADGHCLVPSLRKSKPEPPVMLESVAALWARGVAVKWPRPAAARRIALPTYPFERSRYWVEFNTNRSGGRFDAARHPLLGERIDVAGSSGTVMWRQEISAASIAWLAEHRVHGTCIVPLTAYLEMLARAVAESRDEAAVSISEITIEQPLVIPDDRSVGIQLIATDDVLEIYSRVGTGWKRHASARRASMPPASTLDLPALRARIAVTEDVGVFYADLGRRGHDFGPAFRGITALTSARGEALARVDDPVPASREGGYRMHPALLDACVQTLAAAMEMDETASYLPVALGRFTSFAPAAPGSLWVHAVVSPGPAGDIVTATIRVADQDGRAVAELTDLALRRTTAASLARAAHEDSLLFELGWELVAPPVARFECEPDEIASSVQSTASALMAEHRLDRYDDVRPRVNALCVAGVLDALEDLGLTPGRFEGAALADLAGVVSSQRRLFRRMLEIAADGGAIRRLGYDEWEYQSARAVAADTWAQLHVDYPEFSIELTLSERCVPHLAAVLRGTTDPLQLLFPGGSIETAERLYAETPSARVFNRMLAAAVADMVSATTGPVRILEIGGGTGGSTTHVVPRLPADRVAYTYTDVSPFFVARAREKFAGTPFMQFTPLDIERDPESQQIAAGEHHIVIAANVLHATSDLRRTLQHVRRTLAPGGLLVLLEMTNRESWIDLTFGMTEGWWRFTDRELRPDYPLLTPAKWSSLLCEEGFEAVGLVQAGAPSINTLVLARASASPRAGRGRALVVAGERDSGPRVADALSRMGMPFTILHPRDDLAAAVADGDWNVIVHAAGLDAPEGLALATIQLGEVEREICGSLLAVVRGASHRSGPAVPALIVLTAGANAVTPGECVNPAQAPLWGLVRTIAHEHPELHAVAIDLDPAEPASLAPALASALSSSDGESQLAWRAGARFSARIRPVAAPSPSPARMRLVVSEKGQLDKMQIVPADRRQPRAGQVEVEVDLAGVSFRDVLNALGMYPGDAGPQGGECVGRIVAIGEGVEGFAIGDDVLALAPGSHDGYVLADARLVARKPAGLSAEDALSLPISFITASYTLERLAKMRAGQRVLIHAGTGGVGLAAIQLAIRAGAEVFATAGTAEKRELLRSMGVRHVFNSRTTDFAREILDVTAGRGVDIVLNSLAGDFVDASFAALASGGTFLEIGKNGIWTPARVEALGRNISYFVVDWTEEVRERPHVVGDMLRGILRDAETGSLHALPTTVFRMSDAVNAYRYMSQARHTGRILLRQDTAAPVVHPGGAYLITGGTGGLGLAVARWLAGAGAGALVLVSRTGGSPEARREIAALESRGVLVTTACVDVANPEQMEQLFASLPEGARPLRGIVHAAGVLADGVLAGQDWERFHTVLAPKVEGAWNLHRLSIDEPLDFFVMFSSVASLLGGAGQGNHAAANAFEDALAHARRSAGLPAISINWGAWSGVGSAVRDDLEQRRRHMGLGDLSPQEGLSLLAGILRTAPVQVGAARMDWRRFAEQWLPGTRPMWLAAFDRREPVRSATRPEAVPIRTSWRKELATVPAGNRRRAIEQHVHGLAIRILGFDANRRIDPRQPLNELGLDSLMAVEFRNALASSLETTLPATLLFSYPAIDDLVGHVDAITQERTDAAPAAHPEPVATPRLALETIADLSDEDVDRLLAEKLGVRR